MDKIKQQWANLEEIITMGMIRGLARDMKMTPGGVGEKGDIEVIEKIEGGVEVGTVGEKVTTGQQELTTTTTEGGETAGKGEAPEKSARRPWARGILL